MAKKKTTHQDQTPQKGAKTLQSDDVSEQIENLKTLNAMLLNEIVELRQHVKESSGLLESELNRVEMEKSEMLRECELAGEIERDLMFVFVGVQVSEIEEGFGREIVRIVKEKSEVEEVKREREVEIEGLRREMIGVLRGFESERVSWRCERDELRKEIDGVVEENRGLKLRIGERERGARDEEVDEIIQEKADLVVERDLKAEKTSEVEKDVSRLNDVVLSLRKEEEKLRGNVGVLEGKCGEGEVKENASLVETGRWEKCLVDEKGLIEKGLNEALKHSDVLKSRAEDVSKAKSVVERAKEKQEGEIRELKMQVTDLKEADLKETSRVEKEKVKGLESEVGPYRDEVIQSLTERDQARKIFPEEDIVGKLQGWHSKDSDDSLIIYADMPGLSYENVTVFAEKNTLTIKGQGVKESFDDADADEPVRCYGGIIDLPKKTFMLDSIAAQMRNGVLKLVIPKIKQQKTVYQVVVSN